MSSRSRGALRPRFEILCPPKSEGAGNAGCALHPRSHVQFAQRSAHEHTGQRRASDIPCAMALRLITCSPRRTALLPPLRPEKLASAVDASTATSGPHVFAVRSQARSSIGTASVHRDPPHDRDDHDTPLWSGGRRRYAADLGKKKRNIFARGLDTISENRK